MFVICIVIFRNQGCNNLHLAQTLEFNQPFLSLKLVKISSKDVIRKLIFPVPVCCIYFIIENILVHRDLIQFIEILRQYSNFILPNLL